MRFSFLNIFYFMVVHILGVRDLSVHMENLGALVCTFCMYLHSSFAQENYF